MEQNCLECEFWKGRKCVKSIPEMVRLECLVKNLIMVQSYVLVAFEADAAERDVVRREIRSLINKAKGKLDEGDEWKNGPGTQEPI